MGTRDVDAAGDDDAVVGVGRGSSPATRAAATTPNGAIRLSVRNQTVNVSPCARHSSRPNWAMSASVRTV